MPTETLTFTTEDIDYLRRHTDSPALPLLLLELEHRFVVAADPDPAGGRDEAETAAGIAGVFIGAVGAVAGEGVGPHQVGTRPPDADRLGVAFHDVFDHHAPARHAHVPFAAQLGMQERVAVIDDIVGRAAGQVVRRAGGRRVGHPAETAVEGDRGAAPAIGAGLAALAGEPHRPAAVEPRIEPLVAHVVDHQARGIALAARLRKHAGQGRLPGEGQLGPPAAIAGPVLQLGEIVAIADLVAAVADAVLAARLGDPVELQGVAAVDTGIDMLLGLAVDIDRAVAAVEPAGPGALSAEHVHGADLLGGGQDMGAARIPAGPLGNRDRVAEEPADIVFLYPAEAFAVLVAALEPHAERQLRGDGAQRLLDLLDVAAQHGLHFLADAGQVLCRLDCVDDEAVGLAAQLRDIDRPEAEGEAPGRAAAEAEIDAFGEVPLGVLLACAVARAIERHAGLALDIDDQPGLDADADAPGAHPDRAGRRAAAGEPVVDRRDDADRVRTAGAVRPGRPGRPAGRCGALIARCLFGAGANAAFQLFVPAHLRALLQHGHQAVGILRQLRQRRQADHARRGQPAGAAFAFQTGLAGLALVGHAAGTLVAAAAGGAASITRCRPFGALAAGLHHPAGRLADAAAGLADVIAVGPVIAAAGKAGGELRTGALFGPAAGRAFCADQLGAGIAARALGEAGARHLAVRAAGITAALQLAGAGVALLAGFERAAGFLSIAAAGRADAAGVGFVLALAGIAAGQFGAGLLAARAAGLALAAIFHRAGVALLAGLERAALCLAVAAAGLAETLAIGLVPAAAGIAALDLCAGLLVGAAAVLVAPPVDFHAPAEAGLALDRSGAGILAFAAALAAQPVDLAEAGVADRALVADRARGLALGAAFAFLDGGLGADRIERDIHRRDRKGEDKAQQAGADRAAQPAEDVPRFIVLHRLYPSLPVPSLPVPSLLVACRHGFVPRRVDAFIRFRCNILSRMAAQICMGRITHWRYAAAITGRIPPTARLPARGPSARRPSVPPAWPSGWRGVFPPCAG